MMTQHWMEKIPPLLWLALAGALLGLSAPGYNLWLLAWVGLIPLLVWAVRQNRWQRVFVGGFGFGLAYHLVYVIWFLDLHPMTWLGFAAWQSRLVAIAAWLAFAALGGLLIGILAIIWSALSKRYLWLAALLFPVLWTGGFYLFGLSRLWVPWPLLEYTQSGHESIRALAGMIGSSGIGGLVVFHNSLWASWLVTNERYRQIKPALLPVMPVFLLLLAANRIIQPTPVLPPVPVSVFQGNLAIDEIRAGGFSAEISRKTYLKPLHSTKFRPGTLVVLPEEGVIPGTVRLGSPRAHPTVNTLAELAEERKIAIVAGLSGLSHAGTGRQRLTNTLMALGPDASVAVYHKRRLVPFGEFIPYIPTDWLGRLLKPAGVSYMPSFVAGQSGRLLTLHLPERTVRAGGLVCFELIYPDLAWAYKRAGADMLVNSSNLGWFHHNPVLDAQFIAIGRMRAAETGLPVIIASNTGTSAILAGGGTIVKATRPRHKTAIHFYNK